MKNLKICIFLSLFTIALCQENVQTRIPESLLECYQDPILLQRDYRLPMTMNMLIDLIRKVENDPSGMNMDMRTLVSTLLHRFRLDGVVKSAGITPSSNVVPYSPTGFQFFKHKIILSSLIPGNTLQFPNNSLTSMEKCSLHHMMSSTIETAVRGDEGSVCNRLSQYRTQRLPRYIKKTKPDVEIMDRGVVEKLNKRGNIRLMNSLDGEIDMIPVYSTGTNNLPVSQCPVEDGIVQTPWGAVSVGPLLAGIAAGLQPQMVTLKDLSPGAGGQIVFNGAQVVVDNKFAATLSGDLAEAALRLGPISSGILNVGAPGGWNNTQAPRWYFLSQAKNYEVTDAEIRGALDGLILATNVQSFTSKISSFKLSQLLDMYYSQRGVFGDAFRACNRKNLFPQVAPPETLLKEVTMFTVALDKIMQLDGTINEKGFQEFSTLAAKGLEQYIPNSLNDLTCSATATSTLVNDIEAVTDIYIVLDAMWVYQDIYPTLAYLVENLNISPIGSSVTMLNARDGNVVVNTTNSLADFHQLYNYTVHQKIPTGFDIPKVLQSLKPLLVNRLNNERTRNWGGGQSSVVLTIANSGGISESDVSYSYDLLKIMSEEIPDLRFLYLTSGARERFTNLVKDPAKDIFSLAVSSVDSTASQVNSVIKRIKEVPRRLINQRCGGDWQATTTGNTMVYEYVAPQTINYYRLHPNYYFKSNSKVRIQGNGYGTLNVCYSRSVELPRHSNTSSLANEGITCESVTSNTVEIGLNEACAKKTYIHTCDPLYISVEGLPTTENLQSPRCAEKECRYPDSMKYTMTLEELGCYSCSSKAILSWFTIISIVLVLFGRNT